MEGGENNIGNINLEMIEIMFIIEIIGMSCLKEFVDNIEEKFMNWILGDICIWGFRKKRILRRKVWRDESRVNVM